MKRLTRREFLNSIPGRRGPYDRRFHLALRNETICRSLRQEDSRRFQSERVAPALRPDNRVTIVVNKSEMGQGVHTALPMIVADELGADWKRVKVQIAPAADAVQRSPSRRHADRREHECQTHVRTPAEGGRRGARDACAGRCRDLGGSPRMPVKPAQGMVRHRGSRRKLSFGSLASKASALPVPQNPTLKQAGGLHVDR